MVQAWRLSTPTSTASPQVVEGAVNAAVVGDDVGVQPRSIDKLVEIFHASIAM